MVTTWPPSPSPGHLLQQDQAQGMQDFTLWLIRPQQKNNRHRGWSAPCCLYNMGGWFCLVGCFFFPKDLPSQFSFCFHLLTQLCSQPRAMDLAWQSLHSCSSLAGNSWDHCRSQGLQCVGPDLSKKKKI